MVTGKGYFFFVDRVNRLSPDWYINNKIEVKASNLCTEITLPSNDEWTFTCVLSSLNLSKYDLWKDSSAIFDSLVFLHCVALDFIEIGSRIPGLEKAVQFTRDNMALGLGTLGFHTHLQDSSIPFESMEAHFKNIEIFQRIDKETLRASKWLAEVFGECKVTTGYKVANSHRISIAPNLSSAVICGGVSQGIEPVYKNAYVQGGAAGEMNRVSPSLLKIMKERDVYSPKTIDDIINNNGSVQHVSWLSDHEKLVFKTAFEIDQKAILRLASSRQRYIDQSQSINLFFSADEDEEYISEVHQLAFRDPYIKSLYYIRSESGVQASKNTCLACEG
jgi:ribonucleoside-diphosphate reductase alpha chain